MPISYFIKHSTLFYFHKDNMVTQELAAHDNMQKIAAAESLPRYKSLDVVSAMLLKHPEILSQMGNNLEYESNPLSESAKLLKSYKKELNYKV